MPGPKLNDLLRLAWTWRGPSEVAEDGDTHWEIRIVELPEFFVAGSTREDVIGELMAALRAYLKSCLKHGDLPANLPGPYWRYVAPLGSLTGDTVSPAAVQTASRARTEAFTAAA